MVPFSQSEEAFLFRNVRDIINVWSGGAGQARMNIYVNNGQAELQLTYRLGHPEMRHLPYQPYPRFQPKYQNPPRKQKSEKRRIRDNIRAARYQAAQAVPVSSPNGPTSSSPTTTTTTSLVSPSSVLSTVVTPVSSTNTSLATLSTSTNITRSLATPVLATSHTPSTQAVVTPAPPLASQSYSEDPPAVQYRQEQFTMETMPQQEGFCCGCDVDFAFPCYASPCLVCGLWYHEQCYDRHACSDVDDDDSGDEQNMEISPIK